MKIKILFIVPIVILLFCACFVSGATDSPIVSELLATNGNINDGFGSSVSLYGETLVVGAPGVDEQGVNSGAVYVFTRNGNSWQQQAVLNSNNGTAGDGFGASVSISGETIVVGAPGDDEKGKDSGAAYVFVRSGNSWPQEAKIIAEDGAAGDAFGFDVAIDGDIVVVGAPFDDNKGAAYTFLRSGKAWEQQSKILAHGAGVAGDRFGCSVAIAYDKIIVGADGDDNNTIDEGSAFVYYPYGSGWRIWQKLVAGDPSEGDRFGWSVAVGLNKALVGVNRTQPAVGVRSGAAYVFTPGFRGYWYEENRFQGDNVGTDDGFGYDVAIYDNFYLIGAPRETDNHITSGAVYLFSRSEEPPWPLHAKYIPPDASNIDLFGFSTIIFGDTVVAGVPGRGNGTAYSYTFPCSLGRYLPASEWEMISRPCYNPSPASTIYGDDIAEGIFNKTWVVYLIDPSRAVPRTNPYGYFPLGAAEAPVQGRGNWIYSVRAATLEVNGSPTPTVDSEECPSVNGCVEIPLTWPPSGIRFYNNMVGNPFSHSVDWSTVIVAVTPSDGTATLALTPSEAFESRFMRNSFYRYESKRYNQYSDVTPGMRGTIMPFESIWVHTLDPELHSFPASMIKLLVPAAGPLKTTTP